MSATVKVSSAGIPTPSSSWPSSADHDVTDHRPHDTRLGRAWPRTVAMTYPTPARKLTRAPSTMNWSLSTVVPRADVPGRRRRGHQAPGQAPPPAPARGQRRHRLGVGVEPGDLVDELVDVLRLDARD